ncbi:CocE/NonD family hydrolase [Saccharopolyspora sp. NPDC047091]|uniref:CocE/NonD family hydrolase n=1 Tax=Saccharopolyspora sp. NPDC047091 TaxID=3155924 RepID=UPI00340955E4
MRPDTLFEPSHHEPGPEHGVRSEFDPGTRTLPAGTRLAPRFRALPADIVLDKDVPVPVRDGTTLRVDVLRPPGDDPVPVLVAWSHHGKSHGSSPAATALFDLLGIDHGGLSGLQTFEGPDPAYWCAHGYAVCHPDPRGIAESEGDSALFGSQEGQDCHDLVEWLAEQDWCTGKVGMTGTSCAAVAQWFTAAERPPHLAAINPCSGFSDVHRDLVLRGGMPDTGVAEHLQHGSCGRNRREDLLAEVEAHPLIDALWRDKTADLARITTPAYVVAGYGDALHTPGTFRAWRGLSSAQKWLRTHPAQEWTDYYHPDNIADLRLLDLEGGDRAGLPADRFPPAEVTAVDHHLDAATRTLRPTPPAAAGEVSYDTGTDPALVSFTLRFPQRTELIGYPKAHLRVEARGADDMDLFVLLQQLDTGGTPLRRFTVPGRGALLQDLTERGGSALRYAGPHGRLRVSARHLDATASTADVPVHGFDRVEPLRPGQVVDVDVDLMPIGLVCHPGEQLRLVISSRDLLGPSMPGIRDHAPRNKGTHVIRTGPGASYLRLPIRAR